MITTRRTLAVLPCLIVLAVIALAAWSEKNPETIPERAQAIAASLRCPVCQNLSVADSSSRLAAEMRRLIAERLAAGQSDQTVRRFFVERYGEWILLAPSARGLGFIAWSLPPLAFITGALIWVRRVRGPGQDRKDVAVEMVSQK